MRARLLPSLLLLTLASLSSLAAASELAVIVHPRNPVKELSASELREILLVERQHWRGSGRIYLLLPESGTAEKALLLRRALGVNEDQLHRVYLGKLYAGEITAFPRVVQGTAARRIVERAPNALAIVDAAAVDAGVRVLRIEGRRPGEPGYLLRSQ